MQLDADIPHLAIKTAWKQKYGLGAPKCGSVRPMRLPVKLVNALRECMLASPHKDPEALVFYGSDERRQKRGLPPSDGRTPINHKWIEKKFYRSLQRASIMNDEARRERGIVFHSWRHYLASEGLNRGVPDAQMKKVGGWRSNAMDGYSHAELEDLDKFARLQEELA